MKSWSIPSTLHKDALSLLRATLWNGDHYLHFEHRKSEIREIEWVLTVTKQLPVRLPHKIQQNLAWNIVILKNYSLFIWNLNLTGWPIFLFAKSGNLNYWPSQDLSPGSGSKILVLPWNYPDSMARVYSGSSPYPAHGLTGALPTDRGSLQMFTEWIYRRTCNVRELGGFSGQSKIPV